MRKFIFFITICALITVSIPVKAKNFAILISAGATKACYLNQSSEFPDEATGANEYGIPYWVDLFLLYEYLLSTGAYTHDDILVIYGKETKDFGPNDPDPDDGLNFEHFCNDEKYDRFKISVQADIHPEWWKDGNGNIINIVDYRWPEDTFENQDLAEYLMSKIKSFVEERMSQSERNKLLIYWRGHGYGNTGSQNDSYYTQIDASPRINCVFLFGSPNELIIHKIFTDNSNYPNATYRYKLSDYYDRRKIIWVTCRSGHLVGGDYSFADDKTICMTSCAYNKTSNASVYDANSVEHSGLPFGILACITPGERWYHGNYQYPFYADYNSDGVISISELYWAVSGEDPPSRQNPRDHYFWRYSWDDDINEFETIPQIADGCSSPSANIAYSAKYQYLNENLLLSDVSLPLPDGDENYIRGYRVDKITAENVTIPNDSKVVFGVDNTARLKSGFRAVAGCLFRAKIGDIPCPAGGAWPKIGIEKGTDQYSSNIGNQILGLYPNPASSKIRLDYQLETDSKVRFLITDVLGYRLIRLNNIGNQSKGVYGVDIDVSGLSSGIYFLLMDSGNSLKVKQLILLK